MSLATAIQISKRRERRLLHRPSTSGSKPSLLRLLAIAGLPLHIEPRVFRCLVGVKLQSSIAVSKSSFLRAYLSCRLLLGTCRKQGCQVQSHESEENLQQVAGAEDATAAAAAATIAAQSPAGSLEELASCGAAAGKFDGLCDSIVESRGVGALDGLNASAVVEDLEGGHGGDAVCAGHIALAVSVDLCECNLLGTRVLLCKALVVRSNHLAWAAPVSID
jgi:hypothetical protein